MWQLDIDLSRAMEDTCLPMVSKLFGSPGANITLVKLAVKCTLIAGEKGLPFCSIWATALHDSYCNPADIASPVLLLILSSHVLLLVALLKLHELLTKAEESGDDHIVSWLPGGKAFKVHKKIEFTNTILPTLFNATKYKSFQRNLNLWGFDTITEGSSVHVHLTPSWHVSHCVILHDLLAALNNFLVLLTHAHSLLLFCPFETCGHLFQVRIKVVYITPSSLKGKPQNVYT